MHEAHQPALAGPVRSGPRRKAATPLADMANAPGVLGVIETWDGDLNDDQLDRGRDRDRDQGADDTEHGSAD